VGLRGGITPEIDQHLSHQHIIVIPVAIFRGVPLQAIFLKAKTAI
jgi:hypothetical protein